MQILNGLFGVEAIRDYTLEEYLKHIDGWIEYIKGLNEKLGQIMEIPPIIWYYEYNKL